MFNRGLTGRSLNAGKVSRKEAIKAGADLYWTGKQCKNGHMSYRYVSNWQCRECLMASNANMRYGENIQDQSPRRSLEEQRDLARIERELNGY
jgi:hypothetical protein